LITLDDRQRCAGDVQPTHLPFNVSIHLVKRIGREFLHVYTLSFDASGIAA
jgi:hypothetical protein